MAAAQSYPLARRRLGSTTYGKSLATRDKRHRQKKKGNVRSRRHRIVEIGPLPEGSSREARARVPWREKRLALPCRKHSGRRAPRTSLGADARVRSSSARRSIRRRRRGAHHASWAVHKSKRRVNRVAKGVKKPVKLTGDGISPAYQIDLGERLARAARSVPFEVTSAMATIFRSN